MNLREAFGIGWKNIKRHRIRNSLSTLGITIAVTLLITVNIYSSSMKKTFMEDFRFLNDKVIVVRCGEKGEMGYVSRALPVFTLNDEENIEKLPHVENCCLIGWTDAFVVSNETKIAIPNGIILSQPDIFSVYDYKLNGTTFHNDKEVVVGYVFANEIARNIFNRTLNVGDSLEIFIPEMNKSFNFSIAGIINKIEMSTALGTDHNKWIVTDYTLTDKTLFRVLTAKATSSRGIDKAVEEIRQYLQENPEARNLATSPFVINTQKDVAKTIDKFAGRLQRFSLTITLVSLIVGSIGVTNMMLVAVMERKREIGILKAIGAKNREILLLFLIESIYMGLIGSFVGCIAGSVTGIFLSHQNGFILLYPVIWIFIAIFMGFITGILSGLYPAYKSTKIDVVDALYR